MPGISGIEAPAVPHDIEKGLDAGFFWHLTKPLKVDEFMETLDVALAFEEEGAAQGKRGKDRYDGHV